MTAYAGALEAVERILNRGGESEHVLRAVLAALQSRGVAWGAIRFVEGGEIVDGAHLGRESDGIAVPVVFEGKRVGELELASDDAVFVERVATLISPYLRAA